MGHLGILDARGNPARPAGEPDPAHPGLWFTGYKPQFTGYFDGARIAAKRIGKGIAADLQRPGPSAQHNVVPETVGS